MRLLLAEDEKELSTAVAAILNASGYETDIVSDGVQAVEAAERNSYDCMVFDIMMPGKDGITALSGRIPFVYRQKKESYCVTSF